MLMFTDVAPLTQAEVDADRQRMADLLTECVAGMKLASIMPLRELTQVTHADHCLFKNWQDVAFAIFLP